MRRLPVFVTALLLSASVLLVQPSPGVAQEKTPIGVAIIDVTASSDCSITNRTYATLSLDSKIVDEQVWICPAGTVIMTTPVDSAQEALDLGGIFVPLSGDPDADFSAVQSAKAQIFPTDTRSYSLEQTALLGCSDRSFSKNFSYWASQPGVRVYSTVYYWEDSFCDSGISSSIASLGSAKNLWWRFAEYYYAGPYYYNSHGCVKLSTSATWDTYYISRPLGGLWVDESINESGYYGCTLGGGESYTGSVYL